MPIVLVRIDDRLIHGQVVESWIPYVKAEHVAVVSDEAAADPIQKSLMRLALPEEIGLEVMKVSEASAALRERRWEARRTMILVPGPREILALVQAGAAVGSVNVGGLHYSAGRVQLGRVIFLNDEDRFALKELSGRGVALEGQAVPTDSKMNVAQLLS